MEWFQKYSCNKNHINRHATVFQSDIAGFTKLCSSLKPEHVVAMLHEIYKRYDDLTKELKIEKIETIG